MIEEQLYQILSLDAPAVATALFASLSCALLGNFLLLRKQSLMGDAISHAVLPGIVVAFLVSGSRTTLPVFVGALIAGILTTLLVEAVKRLGNVESQAAMGVVFSVLFALGVVLIEQAAARSVDLDADCLLHGQLESIFWYPPNTFGELFSLNTFANLPREVVTSFFVLCISVLFVLLLFKELRISSFDPQLSTTLGYSANVIYYLLMVFVAFGVVASFEAVGSILVIAMIICPAATARLLTDKLKAQLFLSVVIAALTVCLGYLYGAFAPTFLGTASSLSAAGMMATMSGVLLTLAVFFAPHYGVFAKQVRKFSFELLVFREDILGLLYRLEEFSEGKQAGLSAKEIKEAMSGSLYSGFALHALEKDKSIFYEGGKVFLTKVGRDIAKGIIRSHRLWEGYLVKYLGLQPDHVHQTATVLEHISRDEVGKQLSDSEKGVITDPHGREIP